MVIHPGDFLAGYRVTRLLGRGGMGEVWGAESADGKREVAIKVLLARSAMMPELVRRFEREAKIAQAVTSPFVCHLIEVGATGAGSHLLVFERLTGETLADRLKRVQCLPFSEVGPILDDVLQGLVAAHSAGVVHRDLKPENIFLQTLPGAPCERDGGIARRERGKILDFGVSKITRLQTGERRLTASDATLGSFAYMAPEQVGGSARADDRADIYAAGTVAFRALSGRLPFEGTTAAALVWHKLDKQAPSLAEATGEEWPVNIERFLECALDRRRELRFASAGEALRAWRAILPERTGRGTPALRRPIAELPSEIEDVPTAVDDLLFTRIQDAHGSCDATWIDGEDAGDFRLAAAPIASASDKRRNPGGC